MRIPYLDFGLDRRFQWIEEDQRRQLYAEEIYEIIENSQYLEMTMLQRIRDLLDRKIERCGAPKES
jgi:hypothetical protein